MYLTLPGIEPTPPHVLKNWRLAIYKVARFLWRWMTSRSLRHTRVSRRNKLSQIIVTIGIISNNLSNFNWKSFVSLQLRRISIATVHPWLYYTYLSISTLRTVFFLLFTFWKYGPHVNFKLYWLQFFRWKTLYEMRYNHALVYLKKNCI